MNSTAENREPLSEELSWKDVLAGEKEKPYFQKLFHHLESERNRGKTVYPPKADVFNALSLTPFHSVKVVIVGQDPYHGPGQAHGLCFSVREGMPPPPSLQNIFKELTGDLQLKKPSTGSLEKWTKQGVLLLNTVLTVEGGQPQSHAKLGWEQFTDRIISEINNRREGVVFLLWGSHAIKKAEAVDRTKHCVLTSVHPSPLSAHRGFIGCKHFSKTNGYLKEHGQTEINWSLE